MKKNLKNNKYGSCKSLKILSNLPRDKQVMHLNHKLSVTNFYSLQILHLEVEPTNILLMRNKRRKLELPKIKFSQL